MPGLGSLEFVMIDTTDLERMSTFWSAVLGAPVFQRIGGEYVLLAPPATGGSGLAFQFSPDEPKAKNRFHLDLDVDDVEVATAKIESLGGTRLSEDRELAGHRWRVMADPDGNEFCIG